MTPPLSIDSLVEIVGPSNIDSFGRLGETFRISLIDGNYYSTCGMPWYPASSLRLVEEELKIGDWVRIDNPEFKSHGEIFQISGVLLERTGTYLSDAPNKRHFAECHLCKLTPEEVVFHTGTIGYKMQECSEEIEKATEAMRDLLAPLVDERLSAIEKRQEHIDSQIDDHRASHAKWRESKAEIMKRLDFLEAYQRGERPEVCDCPNGHQIPNGEPIHIVIVKGDKMHTWCDTCPAECLAWCEKVLDSMREG